MKRKCPYCKEQSINRHVEFCPERPNNTYEKMRYDYIIFNFPILTKKQIEIDYVDNRMSLPDIKKKYGIDYKAYQFLLDYYGIHIRGIRESSDIMLKKFEQTCLKKYGVKNVWCKDSIGYQSRIENLRETYGVDNVFQIPEVIDQIKESNHNGGHKKRFKTMIKKYGYKSSFSVPEIHKKALRNSGKRTTKLNKRLYDVLSEYGIEYEAEFCIKSDRIYFYDARIENLLIEINGDYWHCNPIKYDAKYYHKQKKMIAEEVWKHDRRKKSVAIENGYSVLTLWESDVKNQTNEMIYETIKNKINTKNKKEKQAV